MGQVAQLALKHRQNKNQRQRIIVLVCSPVKDSQAALVKLGKKLKKNNVALDIVSFGTPDVDLSIPSLPSSSSSSSSAGGDDDEDEDLKRALALSQGLEEGDVEMGAAGGLDETVDDEDDDIARAIALSMQDAE